MSDIETRLREQLFGNSFKLNPDPFDSDFFKPVIRTSSSDLDPWPPAWIVAFFGIVLALFIIAFISGLIRSCKQCCDRRARRAQQRRALRRAAADARRRARTAARPQQTQNRFPAPSAPVLEHVQNIPPQTAYHFTAVQPAQYSEASKSGPPSGSEDLPPPYSEVVSMDQNSHNQNPKPDIGFNSA